MKKKLLALLFACVLLFQGISVQAVEVPQMMGQQLYYAINDIINYVTYGYHFGITDQELLRAVLEDATVKNGGQIEFEHAMKAIFNELDPYSDYYTATEYQQLMENATGSFSGIGVTYLHKDSVIFISSVFENSPAADAGILPGDLIVSIDGKDVSTMTQAEIVSNIRGESGSVVLIGIKRGKSVVEVPVVRAAVETPEVYWHQIPGEEIAYIQILEFNTHTAEKLEVALEECKAAGLKKIIVDLRDNPGGIMTTVLSCLDYFVPKDKTILNVKFKDEEVSYTSENKSKRTSFELAVLVNENSASASEVFAGAIQDNKVGVLVGETTYGKGTIQQIQPLNTGGGIKLTIGEFFTPNGNEIRNVGVTPNILVENATLFIAEEDLSDLNLFGTFEVGTSAPTVIGIEERLEILGYFSELPDETYTQETAFAIKQFQMMMGYEMTGIADMKTLIALNDMEYESYYYEVDYQLEAAIEALNK